MGIFTNGEGIKKAIYNRSLLDQKKGSKITDEEFKEFEKAVRQEQERVNQETLTWLYEKFMGIDSVLTEIDQEIEEGNKLIFELMEQYSKQLTGKELKKIKKKTDVLSDYFPGLNLIVFPDHSIKKFSEDIKNGIKFIENNSPDNWELPF